MGFFEEHRNLVIGAGVVIVVIVAGALLFNFMNTRKNQAAAEELGSILTAYEMGRFEEALDGNAENRGLVEIAGDYGSTKTGTLAIFYTAEAYYQLGQYDRALEYYERYDVGNDILGASALAGRAAVHEQQDNPSEAADLYLQAADAYDSPATTPDYLLSAARNFKAAGDMTSAEQAYQRYLDDFGDLPNAGLVEAMMAQVEAGGN